MLTQVVVICVLACPTLAWADYQTTPGKRFDISELTTEIKQAVPAFLGCDDTHGTLTFKRERGDFDARERAEIDRVLAAHDPDVAQAKYQQQRSRATAVLKKIGLTVEEFEDLQSLRERAP